MSRDEVIENIIADVLESFDFDRLHNVMQYLDWQWTTKDGEMEVPSTYRLIKRAEQLLTEVAQYYEQDKATHRVATGGLVATLDNDNEELTLTFELLESTAYAELYTGSVVE